MYEDGKENKKPRRIIQNVFTNFAEPKGTWNTVLLLLLHSVE